MGGQCMKNGCDREGLIVELFRANDEMQKVLSKQMDILLDRNTDELREILLEIAEISIKLLKGDVMNKG